MLCQTDKATLIDIAEKSIAYGLKNHHCLAVNTKEYSPELQKAGAAFVTLKLHGELRGCIGSLEAYRPLIEDVTENAYAAAFRDPRFIPLSAKEFDELEYHISVLNPPVDFPVKSEQDLLQQLRPGQDGLILEEGAHRATFLPSVWDGLLSSHDFLHHLKLKAGLPADYWSDSLRFKRYEVEEFS
jgi:AmmeMemoRadiSam system protein A